MEELHRLDRLGASSALRVCTTLNQGHIRSEFSATTRAPILYSFVFLYGHWVNIITNIDLVCAIEDLSEPRPGDVRK